MARNWKQQWDEEGYLVVPGVFDSARTERLRLLCEGIWAQFRRRDAQSGKPGGGIADPDHMRHLNHPDYFLDRPAAHFCDLMDAVADELVLGIARTILKEPAMFRCTTLWHNPEQRSEDGNWHRDTQFGHAANEAAERAELAAALAKGHSGIQMQIALIPSDDVEYVPRSHLRWDTDSEYEIRCANNRANSRSSNMPGALRIPLAAGDAALFNANGLHRGRYRAECPRQTIMLTYTQSSTPLADYFSNQPWFQDPQYLAPLSGRTRSFFEPFVSTYRDQWAAQMTNAGKY